MLVNLKRLYVRMRSFPQARFVSTLLLTADPSAVHELRDRGSWAYHLEDFSSALRDLEEHWLSPGEVPAEEGDVEIADEAQEDDATDDSTRVLDHVKALRRRVADSTDSAECSDIQFFGFIAFRHTTGHLINKFPSHIQALDRARFVGLHSGARRDAGGIHRLAHRVLPRAPQGSASTLNGGMLMKVRLTAWIAAVVMVLLAVPPSPRHKLATLRAESLTTPGGSFRVSP